jgi:hypothetical protein
MRKILFFCSLLLLTLQCCNTVAYAQTNNPPDRIRRGGGEVRVNSTGGAEFTGSFDLFGITTPPVSAPGRSRVYYDSVAGVLRISINGAPYVNLSAAAGTSSATVSSVALSLPTAIFNVTGSPVTNAGTLTASLATQSTGSFFAAPATGGASAPTFRNIVATDVPQLDTSKINSGIFTVARGGTGIATYQTGDLLFANTSSTLTRLAAPTAAVRTFLSSAGDGVFPQPPVWNSLASSDIPAVNLAAGNVAGGVNNILPVTNGGTGLNTIGAGNRLLGVNGAGSGLEYKNIYVAANGNIGINGISSTTGLYQLGGGQYLQALAQPTGLVATANITGTSIYRYSITARDANGNSTTAAGVASVTNGAATPSNTISWNAVSGATSYRLYRDRNDGNWRLAATVTGTSYNDTSIDSAYSLTSLPSRNTTADSRIEGELTVDSAIRANGGVVLGSSQTLTGGSINTGTVASSGTITAQTGATLNGVVTTSTDTRIGKLTQYNGATLAGAGIGAVVYLSERPAQTASIPTVDAYIPFASAFYRVSIYLVTTTAGTGGTVTATFSWNDGTGYQSSTSAAVPLTTVGSYQKFNAQTIHVVGDPNSDGTSLIRFYTTVTSATGSPQYAVYVMVERF